ncbi:Transcriptional regulator, ArsR family / Methyltransferase fusion [Minicystis rosea]|nr:Transcriptional regulator, ArsR family / Methyltransferase fusion [Minicystis rosea]
MDQKQIYERHAAEYDALVAAEDCEGHLLPAIEAIATVHGARVVEVGAGTGRITRLLVAGGARVVAVDRSTAMLEIARRHLSALEAPGSWEIHCADARELPVASGEADVAIAGWVFGHLRYWLPDGWQEAIGLALAEMKRTLRPGGAMIVIETLGTGREDPLPPSPALAEYYGWMEGEHGMERAVIRTDYAFPDVDTAAATTGFFFGEAFGERVREERWRRIPECTGLWWKRV